MVKKVFIASDHAGYDLKEALDAFLTEHGYQVEDLGPHTFDKDDDYPDTILPLALAISQDKTAMGIAIGASGQGEAMICNRYKGVRAQIYYGPASRPQTDSSEKVLDMLMSPRVHENANVLCLAARFLTQEEAKDAVILWLMADFAGEERHVRRIAKLDHV